MNDYSIGREVTEIYAQVLIRRCAPLEKAWLIRVVKRPSACIGVGCTYLGF